MSHERPGGIVAWQYDLYSQFHGDRRNLIIHVNAIEKNPAVPFSGPRDVLARIFCEQWFNFPRYVMSGGFGRAWRGAQ